MRNRKSIIALSAVVAIAGGALCADPAAAAFWRPGFSGPGFHRPPHPGGGVLRPAYGGGYCWLPTKDPRQRVRGPCWLLPLNPNHLPGY